MSEKFTASNGVTGFECDLDAYTSEYVEGMREFFLHERDQELGRWRWPENPQCVVYPGEVTGNPGSDYQECVVIDEATGIALGFGSDLPNCHGGHHREAARAYFAAHSVSKPWHDAKPGEVWALSVLGGPLAAYGVSGDGSFHHSQDRERLRGDLVDEIVDARRIWPEN